METWLNSEIIFAGKIFSVRTGDVRLDDGNETTREIVEHSGGVAIVPIVGQDILLIRQFRISIGRAITELPAGRLERGDTPDLRASIELEEELGYRAGKLILTNAYYSTVGFTNEKMYIYLGVNLHETEKKPEWDERIDILRLPIARIEPMLLNNEFEDAKTIIGLYAMLAYLRAYPNTLNP